MANPFLARLLDTQQRGLQAERERQMRNDAFGNLGFLGQSLQRSFQPLAEMQQREDLQTQAEQARKSLQEQQQNFEQDQKAAELGLKFDRESKNFFREIPARYDPVSQKTEPARREFVNPTQIRADIEAGKARDLARFNTNQSINLFGKKLAIEDQRTIKRLGGRLTPEGLVEIPVRDDNGNILRDNDGKTMYSPPVSLEQAVQASELGKLKKEETIKSDVEVEKAKKLTPTRIEEFRQKTQIELNRKQDEYETITLPQFQKELSAKVQLAKDLGDVELENKLKAFGETFDPETGKTKGGVSFNDIKTRADLDKLTKELAIKVDSTVGMEERLMSTRLEENRQKLRQELNIKEDEWYSIGKDQLKVKVDEAVRQAKEIGANDLAQKLQEYGAQAGESLADARLKFGDRENRLRLKAGLDSLTDELDIRLQNKIATAESSELLEAELNRVQALKEADLALLREHEKIIATDPELQKALVKNIREKAEATAKGQDVAEIDRERRRIGYETLSKGINALIESDNNITVEQIKQLATGTGLSEDALTQMVYSANAQGTRTRIQRKKDLASNPALTKQQQFEILQTIPKDQGGLKGTGLEFKNYEVNGKILDHLIDRGEELTDAELESAGYVTKNSKDLVKKLAGNNKNKRVLQDIATQVSSALQSQPTDEEQRKVFLKELYEGLRADPVKKAALDSKGYDYNWFKGNADNIAREIEKEVADINYKNASAVGQLSSSSKATESTIDKVFRQRMGVLFERYETDPKQLLIEEKRLRANLYGSSDAGPGGTAAPGGPTSSMRNQMFSGPRGSQENQTSQPNNENTVEDNVVAETETNTSSPTVDRSKKGFLDREPESSREAAVQSLESGLDTLNPDASFTKLVKKLNSFFGGKEGSKDVFNKMAEANGGVDNLLKLLETKSDDEIYDFVYESTDTRSPRIRKDIVKAVQESRDFKTNLYD